MSATCIVCLGDLGESAPAVAAEEERVPRPDHHHHHDDDELKPGKGALAAALSIRAHDTDDGEDPGQIARLLPCAHILHNNCLKPWVERANSCPICRRSFNVVELSDHIGGM